MNKMLLAMMLKKYAPALAGYDVRIEGSTLVIVDKKTKKVTRYRVSLEKIVD